MGKLLLLRFKNIVVAGFGTIGAMWTLMEIMKNYFPNSYTVTNNKDNILILVIPALFSMVCKFIYILKFELRIKSKIKDFKIVVKFGNILNCKDGVIIVGVNNQLSTEKDKIAKGSIHRQMVDKYGQDKMLQIFIEGKQKNENNMKYFQKEISGKDFVFLPMSDIDDSGAVSTKTSTVKIALDNLFVNQKNLIVPNNNILIPIIGTGAGGLQPSKQDVIKIIIDSFLSFQKRSDEEVSSKIKTMNVVVYWKDIFEIDWVELSKWLDSQKGYCWDCQISNKKDLTY